MSDLIFKTDGKEGFRIPSPFSNNYYHLPKCPETKLEVKEMTEQPKLHEMSVEEVKEYLKSQQKPQSSYQPEPKKKPDEPPQYFYDISTNLFIG